MTLPQASRRQGHQIAAVAGGRNDDMDNNEKTVGVHSAGVEPAHNLSALAGLINAAHKKAEMITDERLEYYLIAGRELFRAKAEIMRRNGGKRGRWLLWLRKSCPDISRLKAWRLMRFAECSAARASMSLGELWQEWQRIAGHVSIEQAGDPGGTDSRDARCDQAHEASQQCFPARLGAAVDEAGVAAGAAGGLPSAGLRLQIEDARVWSHHAAERLARLPVEGRGDAEGRGIAKPAGSDDARNEVTGR